MLREVRVTAERVPVPAVVLVHAPKMKEAWCLATTLSNRKASEIVKLYGKRFTMEETFRDNRDLYSVWGFRLCTSMTPSGGDCDVLELNVVLSESERAAVRAAVSGGGAPAARNC
jgi:hypothetical protein